MKFIKVLGSKCNSQGLTRGPVYQTKFFLNIDFIAGIESDMIRLKGGDLFIIGGEYYKDIRLENLSDLEKLLV